MQRNSFKRDIVCGLGVTNGDNVFGPESQKAKTVLLLSLDCVTLEKWFCLRSLSWQEMHPKT